MSGEVIERVNFVGESSSAGEDVLTLPVQPRCRSWPHPSLATLVRSSFGFVQGVLDPVLPLEISSQRPSICFMISSKGSFWVVWSSYVVWCTGWPFIQGSLLGVTIKIESRMCSKISSLKYLTILLVAWFLRPQNSLLVCLHDFPKFGHFYQLDVEKWCRVGCDLVTFV